MAEKEPKLVPYDLVEPGFEGVFTGEKSDTSDDTTDDKGNVMARWSTWPFKDYGGEWGDEIGQLDRMQGQLGTLSDEARRIRIHMGGLVLCDSGVPVTIDMLLEAIGSGSLPEAPFKAGCLPGGEGKTSQPGHGESMQTIEAVLHGYLAGKTMDQFIGEFPQAEGFVARTYDWLGPSQSLTELQRLLIERMLLPFEHFCKGSDADYDSIMKVSDTCFGDDGAGAALDERISKLADLPEIQRCRYGMYEKNLETIEDQDKRDLYTLCTRISGGIYELSDCHHNTFRAIENQIYGISQEKMVQIPGRPAGAECERMGRLIFGYALALDRWLLGQPMQFLLLDLGHLDLGFDPKNEILRVYAYLGEDRSPVKQWLAASLWCNLYHNPHGGLKPQVDLFGGKHAKMVAHAKELGISARDWMDSQLDSADDKTDPNHGS